jgi:hypothetical protein
MCRGKEVAYQINLQNVAGKDIINNLPEFNFVEDHMKPLYNDTHFDSLQVDVTEEHYRYGIQMNNFIASGKYQNKPFSLKVIYEDENRNVDEVINVEGNFTEVEKSDIADMAFGDGMIGIIKVLDTMYRKQNPDTPALFYCTN